MDFDQLFTATVISQIAHIRIQVDGGGVGGWAAGGRLYLPIGLFGVSMSPRSAI